MEDLEVTMREYQQRRRGVEAARMGEVEGRGYFYTYRPCTSSCFLPRVRCKNQ